MMSWGTVNNKHQKQFLQEYWAFLHSLANYQVPAAY